MKYILLVLFALCMSGCGVSLHTTIDKALLFEDEIHAEVGHLQTVFEAVVIMLPLDQQQAARQKYAVAYEGLTKALICKDATLKAAADASNPNVNLSELVLPIINAVEAVIAVVEYVKAPKALTDDARARTMSRAMRYAK